MEIKIRAGKDTDHVRISFNAETYCDYAQVPVCELGQLQNAINDYYKLAGIPTVNESNNPHETNNKICLVEAVVAKHSNSIHDLSRDLNITHNKTLSLDGRLRALNEQFNTLSQKVQTDYCSIARVDSELESVKHDVKEIKAIPEKDFRRDYCHEERLTVLDAEVKKLNESIKVIMQKTRRIEGHDNELARMDADLMEMRERVSTTEANLRIHIQQLPSRVREIVKEAFIQK